MRGLCWRKRDLNVPSSSFRTVRQAKDGEDRSSQEQKSAHVVERRGVGKALELVEEDAGALVALLGVVVQDVVVYRLEFLICWDEKRGQDSQRDADC